MEEGGRRIGKGVALEQTESHGRHTVQMAPQQRLAQQQQVSARQEHGLIGSVATRHVLARDAPVPAVKIGDRLIQHRERLECGAFQGPMIAAQAEQLRLFPVQPAADEDRKDAFVLLKQDAQKNRAVKTAAAQDRNLRGVLAGGGSLAHGRPLSFAHRRGEVAPYPFLAYPPYNMSDLVTGKNVDKLDRPVFTGKSKETRIMASDNVMEFTSENWQSEVEKSDQPVLVDFWAPWCGPCRMLGPTIDKIATQFAGKVKVGKLNVDDAQDVAASFGVSSIPRIFIFKGGKTPVKSFLGVTSEAELVRSLNSVLEG